jgi:hypothetical protein
MAGHQGIDRTKVTVRAKYAWRGLDEDVTKYIQQCDVCNRCKKSIRKAKCEMTIYHAGAPIERVHLDFLGPLPKTERGNEHILVIVDQFTKWVECLPLPSQSAEVTARAAVDHF